MVLRGILAASALAGSLLALPVAATAQLVRVDTLPSHATLVCDGRVVGLTPVGVDPDRVRSCTLSANGHRDQALPPDRLDRAVVIIQLERAEPVAAPPAPAPATVGPARPGRFPSIDPATGLLVPLFGTDGGTAGPLPPDQARSTAPARPGPGRSAPRGVFDGPARGQRCCGYLTWDGLLVPCFGDESEPFGPPSPCLYDRPSPGRAAGRPHGHGPGSILRTPEGLLVPPSLAGPGPRPGPGHPVRTVRPHCGGFDRETGLLVPCFDAASVWPGRSVP